MQWYSYKETTPTISGQYLLRRCAPGYEPIYEVRRWSQYSNRWMGVVSNEGVVTHWAAINPPPERVKDADRK